MLIDWQKVKRILVVRLRSIGDTVLATPSLIALRRFLPEAQIDVLLEDWVAPVLQDFGAVDNIITFSRKSASSRLKAARLIRRNRYDVAFNLHGGTTATFFVRASGAKHRVGFADYQYDFLYTHRAPSPLDFWQKDKTHSAEQQLALLGFVGVPVQDQPKSHLVVTEKRAEEMQRLLQTRKITDRRIALIHPAAAFASKQWAIDNFAEIIEYFASRSITPVVIASPPEKTLLDELAERTNVHFHAVTDLQLSEIAALALRAEIFVGNDSGIAHIAAAVDTPSVVIFGSSNINHWRPWTNAPNKIVYEEMPCQPCAGYFCKEFDQPECIKRVTAKSVIQAIEDVMRSPHSPADPASKPNRI